MRFKEAPLREQVLAVGTQFEAILAEITTTLDDLEANEIDGGVDPALREIATFFHADGAFLAEAPDEDEPGAGMAIRTWEAEPGTTAESLPTLLRWEGGWIRRALESGREQVFATAADVPGFLRRAGFRSAVVLPLGPGRTVCVGILVKSGERAWPDGLLRRLRLLAAPIVEALARRRLRWRLEASASFERLLAELAGALLDPADADADLEARDALQSIAELSAGDRVVLFRVREGGTRLEPVQSWSDDGVEPVRMQDHRREGTLRWLSRRLAQGEDVPMGSVEELPTSAARERRHFRRVGCRAFVRIPLRVGGRVAGILGVDQVEAERTWPEELRERLRQAGRLLLWALDRSAPLSHDVLPAPPSAPGALAWSGGPGASGLPSLDRLPAGTSILVIGEPGRGREIVLRAPLHPDAGSEGGAAWEMEAVPVALPSPAPAATAAPGTLHEVERAHVLRVLEQCGWKINGSGHAADSLGLKPSTLRYRMRKLGIERPATR